MKIIVCLKAVRGDYVSSNEKDQNDYVINPYDLFALQMVLDKRTKDKQQVVCLSMGGANSKDALIKSIALGADDVYWLCDSAFAGADTVATSYTLAESIKKIGDSDLIVCGEKAVDGETGQVGIGVCERLNIPCVTNVEEIVEIDDKSVIVKCIDDKEMKIVKVCFPAMIVFRKFTTVINNMSLLQLKKAQRKPMNIWDADTIGLEKEKCGFKGSKTQVLGVVSDINKNQGIVVKGNASEQIKFVDELITSRNPC